MNQNNQSNPLIFDNSKGYPRKKFYLGKITFLVNEAWFYITPAWAQPWEDDNIGASLHMNRHLNPSSVVLGAEVVFALNEDKKRPGKYLAFAIRPYRQGERCETERPDGWPTNVSKSRSTQGTFLEQRKEEPENIAEEPVEQPAEEPVEKPIEKPIEKPAEQPKPQPKPQPAPEPEEEPPHGQEEGFDEDLEEDAESEAPVHGYDPYGDDEPEARSRGKGKRRRFDDEASERCFGVRKQKGHRKVHGLKGDRYDQFDED